MIHRLKPLTGDGYLRRWQMVRLNLLYRRAASRLLNAASEWVAALEALTSIDNERRAVLERQAEESPRMIADDGDDATYGG